MDIETTTRFLLTKDEIEQAVKDFYRKKFAQTGNANHVDFSEEVKLEWSATTENCDPINWDDLNVIMSTKNEFKNR